MEDTKTTAQNTKSNPPVGAGAPSRADMPRNTRRPGGPSRGGRRSSFDRPKPEFEQKILQIRRVTRVVAGGRRMSFSVAMVIGDKKGSVGVGTGKAGDTALAIGKALKSAKKNMITIAMTKDKSIPFDIDAKFSSCSVMLMPNKGKGLVAGSSVRDILTLAGITNVTSKIHSGSKNKLNNAKAAMQALAKVRAKKVVVVPAEIVPEIKPELIAQ